MRVVACPNPSVPIVGETPKPPLAAADHVTLEAPEFWRVNVCTATASPAQSVAVMISAGIIVIESGGAALNSTATGTSLRVAVESLPSSPYALLPQHSAPPEASAAQVVPFKLTDTDVAPLPRPFTCVGV